MEPVITDMKELTDSRELLEARPHPALSIIMFIFLVALTISLIWSYFGEIDIVVKANGVVRPNESVSSVRNIALGTVDEVHFENGQAVTRGELLYTLESADLEVRQTALEDQLVNFKRELELLQTFKQSVYDGRSRFVAGVEGTKEYEERFLKYQTDYKKLENELERSRLELNQISQENALNQRSVKESIARTENEIENLQTLEKSVLTGENLFTMEDRDYYNRYVDYELNFERLSRVVDERKQQYDIALNLAEHGAVPAQEVKNRRNEWTLAKLDLDNYANEHLLNLRTNIEENISRLKTLKIDEGKTVRDERIYSSNSEYSQIALEKYKLDTIVETNAAIQTLEENIKSAEEQLKTLEVTIQDRKITAPMDGIVNVITEINKGELLQTGVEALTIVPKHENEFKAQLSVLNEDIADIRIGDQIKYHFLALPYKEYGELSGTVEKIGTDAIIDERSGQSYYVVEASINNEPLYGYKGEEAHIKVGMVAEAYIVSKTKKILYYLLEKIDLRE